MIPRYIILPMPWDQHFFYLDCGEQKNAKTDDARSCSRVAVKGCTASAWFNPCVFEETASSTSCAGR